MSYYILTTVAEREITTESFKTLAAAQNTMHTEFMNALRDPDSFEEGMDDSSIGYNDSSAYINYDYANDGTSNMDWSISYLDDAGIIHPLTGDGDILNHAGTEIITPTEPSENVYDLPAEKNTGTLRCRIYSEQFHTADIEVPKNLTLQQAITYAESALDTDKQTLIDGPHYLPGSEEFDDEDRQNPNYFKFV